MITFFLSAISIAVELGRIWLCSGLVKAHRFGKEIPRAWLQYVEIGVGWVSSDKCWVSSHLPAQLNLLVLQDASGQPHFGGLQPWVCREERRFAALFGFGNSISPCAEPHPCYENEEFHSDV